MNNLQDFGSTAQSQFETLGKRLVERQEARSAPLPVCIRVAETNGDEIPPLYVFRDVTTREVSTTNMIFVDCIPPRARRLVVLIGGGEKPVYLAAKVLHIQECRDQATPTFLVACQLLERLKEG